MARNCIKGNPCGNSCISKKRQCRKKAGEKAANTVSSLSNRINSINYDKSSQHVILRGKFALPGLQDLSDYSEKLAAKETKYITNAATNQAMLVEAKKRPNSLISLQNTKTGKIDINAIIQPSIAKRALTIQYVASAPRNLDKANKDYVPNVGTRLILELVKESKRNNFDGSLIAILPKQGKEAAQKYYEGFGFTKSAKNEMTLAAKSADNLLAKAVKKGY